MVYWHRLCNSLSPVEWILQPSSNKQGSLLSMEQAFLQGNKNSSTQAKLEDTIQFYAEEFPSNPMDIS